MLFLLFVIIYKIVFTFAFFMKLMQIELNTAYIFF